MVLMTIVSLRPALTILTTESLFKTSWALAASVSPINKQRTFILSSCSRCKGQIERAGEPAHLKFQVSESRIARRSLERNWAAGPLFAILRPGAVVERRAAGF